MGLSNLPAVVLDVLVEFAGYEQGWRLEIASQSLKAASMECAAIRLGKCRWVGGDREGIAFTELARLFKDTDKEKAAHYFRETLKLRELQEASGPETQEALLYLAVHCKDTGNLQEAQQYAQRLLDFGGRAACPRACSCAGGRPRSHPPAHFPCGIPQSRCATTAAASGSPRLAMEAKSASAAPSSPMRAR